MTKGMKRAGIVFFVLVLSCLIAFGCCSVLNVSSDASIIMSTNSSVNTDNINNQNNGNHNATYNGGNISFDLPTADKEYFLECTCGNVQSCTCNSMEQGWNNAVQESINKGLQIKVTLKNDWIAKTHEKYTTSFGEDSLGFNNGRITIVEKANIIIDLNGYDIDRHLTEDVAGGNIITVFGKLDIMDSGYDESAVKAMIEKNGSVGELSCGKITGGRVLGATNQYGSIFISKNAEFNMYSGAIYNNGGNGSAGGIGALSLSGNSLGNIYGGIIAENYAIQNNIGGLLVEQDAILNMYGGYLYKNSTPQSGGGIFAYQQSVVNIYGGTIVANTAKNGGGGIYTSGKLLNIYDGTTLEGCNRSP